MRKLRAIWAGTRPRVEAGRRSWVDPDRERVANRAAFKCAALPDIRKGDHPGRLSDLDPVYGTDDYPREGCALGIDVRTDGYHVVVSAPNGAHLESYAPMRTVEDLAGLISAWVKGGAAIRDFGLELARHRRAK